MAVITAPSAGVGAGALRAFLAICRRDIFVTGVQFPVFLAQVLLQPLFFLFIFGRILTSVGFARPAYATVLLPGIVALTVVTTAIQSTSLPLVLEFSFTKEIEDRLLAPLPVSLVAVQKIVIASLRGVIGGIVIFPLGAWIIGNNLHLSTQHVGTTALFIVMGALIGSAIGLTMGTFVEARQINIMFAIIFTPLLFTGCTQYPWESLKALRWFQIVTLFNPITYVSEGLRGALVPQLSHMDPLIAGVVLLFSILLFSAAGIYGFDRRAVD
jgi:ABC-2 type transport system permease protein